jgi:hypothetical protein
VTLLADLILRSDIVPFRLEPGVEYATTDGERVVYVGPHADRFGAWTGKLRMMSVRSHQERVLTWRKLVPPPEIPGAML